MALEFKSKEEYEEFREDVSPEVRKDLPTAEKAFPKKKREKGKPKLMTEEEYQRRRAERGETFLKPDEATAAGWKRWQKGKFEAAERGLRGTVRGVSGAVTRIDISRVMPRGVRHPDSLVKRPDLYLIPHKRIKDPMQLYFGTSRLSTARNLPPEAQGVMEAIRRGHNTRDEIEAVTGLTPQEVSRGIDYLERKGLLQKGTVTE